MNLHTERKRQPPSSQHVPAHGSRPSGSHALRPPESAVPRKPDATKNPRAKSSRPKHLIVDAQTGTVHTRFPAAVRNSKHDDIEQCLDKRLAASVREPDPRPSRRVCQAADQLLQLMQVLQLPTPQCLSLAQDDGLWAACLLPKEGFSFATRPANPDEAPALRLAAPVNRRLIAALLTALLERGLCDEAMRIFKACPLDVDRRLVLKCLLQQAGPSGGVLKQLSQPEHIEMFDRACEDMLSCADAHGKPRYTQFQPSIQALRAGWHATAAARPLKAARERLLACGCAIHTDAEGEQHLLPVGEQALDPAALDALLHYVALAWQNEEAAPCVHALVQEALAIWGLHRPAETADALITLMDGIQSALPALQFIHDINTGLDTLRTLANQERDPERRRAWQAACQPLLQAMVQRFASLVDTQASPGKGGWEPLAQWLWATHAALSLSAIERDASLPAHSPSPHAHCLSYLHQCSSPLGATLALLCPPDLLSLKVPPATVGPHHVQDLFAVCPLATRQAVLRLPVLSLWMRKPVNLDIAQFLTNNGLSPERQAMQVMHLIDSGVPMAKLPDALEGVLDTASFAQMLARRMPAQQDAWWLAHALRGLLAMQRTEKTPLRPRALPNLLDLYRRIIVASTGLDAHGFWTAWRDFVEVWSQLVPLEAQDWNLLGTYLPLGPSVDRTLEQIEQLGKGLPHALALLHMLQAWLAQRFAEATDPAQDADSVAAQQAQFQAVWAHTKRLLKQLTREQRTALGKEGLAALDTLVWRCESLFKKS